MKKLRATMAFVLASVLIMTNMVFASDRSEETQVQECNNQTISFSASDDGKWYDGYLNYCVKNRIVSSDEYSSLDAYATRAQIAHIFAKATSDFAVVNDIDYDYIPDVSERSEYADEILALYRAGILTGDERTRAFRPSDTITRAEAAAIISRVALPTTRIKIV